MTFPKLFFILVISVLLFGCATSSVYVPDSAFEDLEEKNLGKGLQVGVLANPALDEPNDENRLYYEYLKSRNIFWGVDWCQDLEDNRSFDYIFHITVSTNSDRYMYRTFYLFHILSLGIPTLIGSPIAGSHAHYTGSLIVYDKNREIVFSKVLYNYRNCAYHTIYWEPNYHSVYGYEPLFEAFQNYFEDFYCKKLDIKYDR